MADEIEIAFDIVDQVTVARLIEENPDLLPHISVDKAAVLHYNKSKLNNTILAGILQGETIPQMVANLTQSMIGSNLSTAYRSIRTAVTSAENGGRYARYQALEKSGVTGMKKQWLATGDSRTRESHMAINGETVDNSKPFSNGLMYPGDPNGTASEVYNCRCAMRMVLAGVNDQSAAQYRADSVQLFQNWLSAKQKAAPPVRSGMKIGIQFFAYRNSSDYPTVWLEPQEYAHVMSEITTNLTEEQRNSPTFYKNVGNYTYYIENNGGLNFRIIKKFKIRTYKKR